MEGKKKERPSEILLSHLRNLRGNKRLLLRLLSPLIVIPVFLAIDFVRPRVSYEKYQLFLLLLVLVVLSVAFILSKYEKSLKGNERDGEGTENLEIHHQNKKKK